MCVHTALAQEFVARRVHARAAAHDVVVHGGERGRRRQLDARLLLHLARGARLPGLAGRGRERETSARALTTHGAWKWRERLLPRTRASPNSRCPPGNAQSPAPCEPLRRPTSTCGAHSTCTAKVHQPQATSESKQRRGVARCCSCVRSRLRAAEDEHAHAHAHDRRARRGGHGQRAASTHVVRKPDGLLWLQTARARTAARCACAFGPDTRTCARRDAQARGASECHGVKVPIDRLPHYSHSSLVLLLAACVQRGRAACAAPPAARVLAHSALRERLCGREARVRRSAPCFAAARAPARRSVARLSRLLAPAHATRHGARLCTRARRLRCAPHAALSRTLTLRPRHVLRLSQVERPGCTTWRRSLPLLPPPSNS